MSAKTVVYHIARNRGELEQAFSLVYKEYACKGYISRHYKSRLRLSFFNALPSTSTFVAKQGNRVVATVTLIPDSPLGIPMDKIYKERLDGLRKKKRRVAEVSQLAIDSKLFPKNWFSMFNFSKLMFIFRLFKLVLDHALYVDKLTDLCIAVNPRHQYLYKFLGFEMLGGLKYYGSVNKAPAIAKRLDLETVEERAKARRGLYKVFFSKRTDNSLFEGKFKLSASDIKYFFVNKSDIFNKATKNQLKYISISYQDKGVGKLIEGLR